MSTNKASSSSSSSSSTNNTNDDSTVPVSLRGSDMDSDTLRSTIPEDASPYTFPFGPDTNGEHCWSQLDGTTFQVRGPGYLDDKIKIASQSSFFDLMHFDMFRSNDKIGNVAARHDSWLRTARKKGDTRYYFVVVYVTPSAPYIHLVLYFAVQPDRVRASPHFATLWEQFTAHGPEGDAFRNERWKVIPRVAEGSWIVTNAVGAKPALLATKLTHTWIICDGIIDNVNTTSNSNTVEIADTGCSSTGSSNGGRSRGSSFSTISGPGPYLECDCDVASSSMAYVLVSLLQSYAKYIVIDLGFAIEPREMDTLPEVVLGSVRLSRIDVDRPIIVDAEPQDWILGTEGQLHGNKPKDDGGDDD